MAENANQTYRDRETVETYVGDPFAGIPVARETVEEVADRYDLKSDVLARALRALEQTPDLIDTGVLFSGFDPTPVGTDEDGHLYLVANATTCWDVAAERLKLTTVGREAVATVHDRHIREHGQNLDLEDGVGFIVPCPEFPDTAVDDVHTILERTTLTARQATVWALCQHALKPSASADILSIPEAVVESELAAVDRETERITEAARTLDVPNRTLTRLNPEPNSDQWLGLEWSPWLDLQNRDRLLQKLPRESGLYRVRHTGIRGLLYIGETGSDNGLRDRVGLGLASGLDDQTPPRNNNHDATMPLWRISTTTDSSLEVSVATPPVAANRRHRLSLEAALVAVCRRETGRTPFVMLNRNPIEEVPQHGGDEGFERSVPSRDESYRTPNWNAWRSVTSTEWMGLDWTDPRPLAERVSVAGLGTCAFRVWESQEETNEWDRMLNAVGTTESLPSRLFTLQREYGPETVFSVAELPELSTDDVERSRELHEVRYDLIGAHYLAAGEPPLDQY